MTNTKAVVVTVNYDGNQVHLFDTPNDAKEFCRVNRTDKEYGNEIVVVAYGDPFVCISSDAIDVWCREEVE